MTATLELNNIAFSYGHQTILDDISFAIEPGEIGCLLGPSGCGKSTLLRLIAGFEKPQAGNISIDGQLVADRQHSIPPQNRQVGMLFQDLALFPHLTVADNIAFGLHQLNSNQQNQRVTELLELCRLQGFQSRYPHQLSGGQCQRVALARAMAPKPKLILLDEPFSSVETGLQSALVHEVQNMLQADQSTALWVTHSFEEAFAVADRIGVMLNGQLLQWSTPTDLYDHPEHPDIIRFLNHANLISGQLNSALQLETAIGLFSLSNQDSFKSGEKVQIAVNKQHIVIKQSTNNNAMISSAVYQGGQYLISATLQNKELIQFYHPAFLQPATSIYLQAVQKTALHGFKA